MDTKFSATKTNAFLDYYNASERPIVEIFVDGLGWLLILKENIEIVSDNWFASSKFMASTITIAENNHSCMHFKNVYINNSAFAENANNVKYNLVFDEICIYVDKIVAFH